LFEIHALNCINIHTVLAKPRLGGPDPTNARLDNQNSRRLPVLGKIQFSARNCDSRNFFT